MRATSKVFYSIATYLLVSLIVYIFGVTFVKDDGYLYGCLLYTSDAADE